MDKRDLVLGRFIKAYLPLPRPEQATKKVYDKCSHDKIEGSDRDFASERGIASSPRPGVLGSRDSVYLKK